MRVKRLNGIGMFFCLILLFPFLIKASGGVGSDFLRFEPPARTAAMSNAFAGISDDINAVIYNPAGLTSLKNLTLSFTHFSMFADSNCEFLSGAVPVENGKYGVIGGGIFVDYTFDFPYYDEYGDKSGNVDSYDLVGTASYAYPILDFLSAGINLKYFYSKLYIYSKSGFAADLGVLIKMGKNPDTFAGIVLQNFGTQSAYISVVDPLPTNIKAGMGIKIKIAEAVKLAMAIDVNRLVSKDETPTLDFGADLNIFEVLCLRAGYGFRHDISGVSLGIGVLLDNVTFAYSYQPFDVLGSAHRISLDLVFSAGTENKKHEEQQTNQ
jgi:hypothetical protein